MKNLLRLLAFSFLPFLLSAQNYFEPLGGPIGLDVKSSFKDVNGVIYIKAYHDFNTSKHLKSNDGGNNWLPFMINDSIQVDKLNADEVPFLFAIGSDGVLYRSDENSGDWMNIFTPDSPSFLDRLSISSTGSLFFSIYPELFLSVDKGDAWSLISDEAFLMSEIEFHPNGDIFSVASSNNEIYLANSDDGGSIWQNIYAPNNPFFDRYKSVHISNAGIIFLKENSGDIGVISNFYISQDNGETFSTLLVNKSYNAFLTTNAVEDIFYSDRDKVFHSKDKGQTWSDISSGIPTSSLINHIYIDDDQYIYLSLNNDVLYKSFSPSDEITPVNEMGNEPIFDFKIFSNPATDHVSFQLLTHQPPKTATFRIIDASGRVVQEIERTVPNELHTVPVSDWTAGVYFLQYMENGEIRASERFLVLE